MNRDSGPRKRKNWLGRVMARLLLLRGREGSTMVEMAIVLPALMIVITGAASFGVAFYFFQQLSNATSVAVQLVAADQGLVADPCAAAQSSIQSSLASFTPGNFSYSMTVTSSSGTTTYGSTSSGSPATVSFTCVAAGDGTGDTSTALAPNEPVSLTVGYKYNWIPILGFTPGGQLTSVQGAIAQ